MEEFQFAGLALVLLGALPIYLLARHIEKHKHWSLFAGWDPSKISDQDAYGMHLCRALKAFSVLFGLGGAMLFFGIASGELMLFAVVILPVLPLFYQMSRAKALYGKKPPD